MAVQELRASCSSQSSYMACGIGFLLEYEIERNQHRNGLGGISSTPPRADLHAPHIHSLLTRLATKPGEKQASRSSLRVFHTVLEFLPSFLLAGGLGSTLARLFRVAPVFAHAHIHNQRDLQLQRACHLPRRAKNGRWQIYWNEDFNGCPWRRGPELARWFLTLLKSTPIRHSQKNFDVSLGRALLWKT